MKRTIPAVLAVLCLLPAALAEDDEQAQLEAKLREGLRNTMMQLREAQAKTAEMEATSVRSQQEAEKLKKELAALQAQMLDERNAAANQAAELRAAVEQGRDRITFMETQVAKWEKDYAALVQKTRAAEADAAKAKARIGVLERTVAEQQVKNVEMKTIADEILDRYSRHSLGQTVLAREPFISVNRAKLQTIMQDLETRLRAATIVP